MGLAEILTVIFVVAKLMGFIGWSWWIVFIPMYPALAIYAVMIVSGIVGAWKIRKTFKDMEW